MNRSKREIVSAITAQLNELVEQEKRAARQPAIFAEKYARRTIQDRNLQKSAELEWL